MLSSFTLIDGSILGQVILADPNADLKELFID